MPDFPTAPKGSAYANLFAGLKSVGSTYAGATAKGGLFSCPVHDDENASLSVDEGRKGIPLISCPPCEASDDHVTLMDNLRGAGVFVAGSAIAPGVEIDWGLPAPGAGRSGGRAGGVGRLRDEHKLVAKYDYCLGDGSVNFTVSRWEPKPKASVGARKVFVPSHLEIGVGRVNNLNGVERTPYLLERFSEWAGAGLPLYLVEGEKAADALAAAGKAVTTFHGGAKQVPADGWVERYGLDRFTEVRCWPDADEVGVRWMERRKEELEASGVTVSLWGPVPGSCAASDDAYDVLGRGERPVKLDAEGLASLIALKPVGSEAKPETLDRVDKKLIAAASGEIAPDPYGVCAAVEPYRFAAELLAREFTTEDGVLKFRYRNDEQTYWLWSDEESRYVCLSADEVSAIVSKLLSVATETDADGKVRPVKVKSRIVGEISRQVSTLTLTSPFGGGDLIATGGGVPFRNGWLDAVTGELTPIGPDRDIRWNVPADYEPRSKCPEWLSFLDTLGWEKGAPERRLLRQWFGYLISGDVRMARGMLLLGPKRAGKGTILTVADALLGDGATAIQLDTLASDFGLQSLLGKGLATIGDARFGMRTDPLVIERLLSITGNDRMLINQKFKQQLSLRLPTRLMIATNESPRIIEASDALPKRMEILEFTKSFYGQEDINLASKILEELPGVARWALGGYRDLLKVGHFSSTPKGLELREQIERDAAPVRVFVEDECELDSTGSVPSQELYNRYVLWCARTGTFKLDRQVFYRDLNTAFPGLIETQYLRLNGKRVYCKKGIRIS